MPDIAMCKGEGCPLKEQCLRYTAKPGKHMQSYFTEVPYDKEKKECQHFLFNEGWGIK
tara:strand:- start:1198 stop:1371 length:174 start_codon:yes stop_codon:yes gene_type:complete